jgi:nifR3 family TIM-barrel protein
MVLAPMADVTDAAFRRVIAKYGKPDVMWTEFVSADGLYHTRELLKKSDAENPLMRDLAYGENERPIVAQLFSSDPAMMEYASALVAELGFDGVDINMGCPDRTIEKQKAGAALMKNPEYAREIIRSAQRGVAGKIPVSVKTRIGYNKNELSTWLPEILKENPDAVTVHARTRKEMSLVPARWEHVAEAVRIRDALKSTALILGNGDVENLTQARARVEETGADGVMIGRGIFGNPWLFSEHQPTLEEKLRVLEEHTKLFEELCSHKSFAVMKKHFKAYINGFDGAKQLRAELMECDDASSVTHILEEVLTTLPK